MHKKKWTTSDIPPQTGKIALVTGGTSGLGFQTSLVLAQAGATVILTGRNETRGKAALDKIWAICPEAKIEFGKVDQSSLKSVAEFAASISSKYDCLDILINNAGMAGSEGVRKLTVDGLEMTFATNYLSHFALTAHLLPLLRKSSSTGRVVNVTGLAYKDGKINFDDLQSEKGVYKDMEVVGHSKLANLLFAFELQRKSDAGGWGIMSTAVHPGISRTEGLAEGVTKMEGVSGWLISHIAVPLFSQTVQEGALHVLFTATSPKAKGGGFYGPTGFQELSGPVGSVGVPQIAKDGTVGSKLWDVSVQLTGVKW